MSARRVRRHVEVENDILSIARWIAKDRAAAAERFLSAAEETILGLSYMPERGSLKGWRGKRYERIRTWAVRGFPNHLIVYEVREDGFVYVFTVVHGARDYRRIVRDRSKT